MLAHHLDKRLKCFSTFELCRINHGFQRRLSFRRPLGAETVSHFSMNDRRAQRLFTSVVGRRNLRMIQEIQQMILMLHISRVQLSRDRSALIFPQQFRALTRTLVSSLPITLLPASSSAIASAAGCAASPPRLRIAITPPSLNSTPCNSRIVSTIRSTLKYCSCL